MAKKPAPEGKEWDLWLGSKMAPEVKRKYIKPASEEAKEKQEEMLEMRLLYNEDVARKVKTELELINDIIDKVRAPQAQPKKDVLDYAQWVVLTAIAITLAVGLFVQI
jgi:hypothetical protein